ncbi:MAG: hypothetical protein J6N49_02475 [Alphaproteobacteria bacterium]|nr:hypothetical protein [Alphaproteobacteria bacterium]
MNELFESLRNVGFSQNDALAYALWLEKQSAKMPLKLENWWPTPLPIGYLGKNNQLVRLPFLDTNHKDQVFGIMVGDMCLGIRLLGRNCGGDMYHMAFIGLNNELKNFRNRLYPPYKSFGIFSSESVYARDLFVPNLNQMQQAYLHKDAFDATVALLEMHAIGCGIRWRENCFLCRDDKVGTEMQEYHLAVDFQRGVVEKWDPKVKDKFFVRAALPINECDPPYPIDNSGCFDWTIWREECEPCLDEDPQAVHSRMFDIFMK